MAPTETSSTIASSDNSWRFVATDLTTPFSALTLTTPYNGGPSAELAHEPRGYYGASFPPELYQELRVFVQTKGWNTLLDGVTFRSGDAVVELGFGDGGNTAQLARDLREHQVDCMVYGVELSSDMVSTAQERYPRADNPNLILVEGAAQVAGSILQPHLHEQGARPITLVISNYTLHWVRDPGDPAKFLLKEMFCSINPLQPIGGEQRHFCAHRDAFQELFEAGYCVIRENERWQRYFKVGPGDYAEHGEWRHPPLITEDGINDALSAAGYSGTATLHEDVREFPSVDLLKAWVKTMIRPFMNRIEDDQEKQDFVDAWIERYLCDTDQQSDKPVKLWDRNLLIVARKERNVAP